MKVWTGPDRYMYKNRKKPYFLVRSGRSNRSSLVLEHPYSHLTNQAHAAQTKLTPLSSPTRPHPSPSNPH
ncbi:hypothetical protein LguiA_026980 [Lonicera macranthoides]